MFRNLLKYDMRSVWKVWRVMAVALFALSVVGAFVLRYITENFDKLIYSSLGMLLPMFLLFAWLSIIAAAVITNVFVYLRFYKNFFTDEGYLTFTLPASRKMLLGSKTLNAMIWSVLLFLLYLVCAVPFAVISSAAESEGQLINLCIFEGIGELINIAWSHAGAWVIVYALIVVFGLLVSAFYSVAVMQLCITVGSLLVKKAKVLLSIGLYVGFSMVTSTISMTLRTVFFITLYDGFEELTKNFTENEGYLTAALIMTVLTLITAALAFAIHSVTRICIERKLNLA